MNSLLQDLRYGLRTMRKSPGVTAIAVLSLALGIGANTALFSIVDSLLLKMLPVKEPQRLVLFRSVAPREFSAGSYHGNSQTDEAGRKNMTSFPYQSFQRMREQQSGLSDLFAFGDVRLNVTADGLADVASGRAVSGNYFAGLGVPPLLGRTLTEEDDKASASPVAVISYRYWQQRFGGNQQIVGKQINLNNVAFTIVGVTPAGFEGTTDAGSTQDVNIPIAWEPSIYVDRQRSYLEGGDWWLLLMGRLKPGATAEQARAQLENAFLQSVIEHRTWRQAQAQANGGNPIKNLEPQQFPHLFLDPGGQGEMNSRREFAPSLYLLLGVVGMVLLIACANVANLLLSRAASRQKEMALRLALGASRWRLIRQLLTESVLLAGLGGSVGILFALWIKDGLLAVGVWGGSGMRALEPQLDLRVLAFTFALSLLTGLIFGMAPAWRSTKLDLTPTLKDSGRGSSASNRSLLSRGLVVLQVALSLLLLIGAGLFVRTLVNLKRVDPGFNTKKLLLFSIQPILNGYKDEKLAQLYQQLSERLETVASKGSAYTVFIRKNQERQIYFPVVKLLAHGVESETEYQHEFFSSGEYRSLIALGETLNNLIDEDGYFQRGDKALQSRSFVQGLEWLMAEARKGYTIQRYKGLGEMNPEQLWETTMDPEVRRMLKVTIEDAVAADQIFTTLMGDQVEPRREFIEQNALSVANLDV